MRANIRASASHLRHGSADARAADPERRADRGGRGVLAARPAWSTSSTAFRTEAQLDDRVGSRHRRRRRCRLRRFRRVSIRRRWLRQLEPLARCGRGILPRLRRSGAVPRRGAPGELPAARWTATSSRSAERSGCACRAAVVAVTGWDSGGPPIEAGAVEVAPGAHALSVLTRRPFDGARHVAEMRELLGPDWTYMQRVDTARPRGLPAPRAGGDGGAPGRWSWIWVVGSRSCRDLAAVARGARPWGRATRRPSGASTEHDRARPHYVSRIALTADETLPGGFIRVSARALAAADGPQRRVEGGLDRRGRGAAGRGLGRDRAVEVEELVEPRRQRGDSPSPSSGPPPRAGASSSSATPRPSRPPATCALRKGRPSRARATASDAASISGCDAARRIASRWTTSPPITPAITPSDARDGVGGVEHRLLVLLQVLLVAGGHALHEREHAAPRRRRRGPPCPGSARARPGSSSAA